jgi:hypothetical protein
MMFVPHMKHAYGPPRPVTAITLLFLYVDDVREVGGTCGTNGGEEERV